MDQLFACLVSLINSDVEIAKVRNALTKVSRNPGENVAIPIKKIKSLYVTLYGISRLEWNAEKALLKANNHALSCVRLLINSHTVTELARFTKLKQSEDTVNFISSAENQLKECRFQEQTFLPREASHLDINSFDASSLQELIINKTGMKQSFQADMENSGNRGT